MQKLYLHLIIAKHKNTAQLPYLNTLRFFAALFVIIAHAETMKARAGAFSLQHFAFARSGGVAVYLFFVLSGFLISYQLLQNYKRTHKVRILHFYWKRALRIFPLYFFMVFLATIVLPLLLNFFPIHYTLPYRLSDTWQYYVFFVPALVYFYFGRHALEVLWSIGVEEYFYLFWAPLFYFFRRHFLSLIALLLVLRIALSIFVDTHYTPASAVHYLFSIFSIELFCMGALGAWIFSHCKNYIARLRCFQSSYVCVAISALVLYFIFWDKLDIHLLSLPLDITNGLINTLLFGALAAYVIIGISRSPRTIKNPIIRFLEQLGALSYGMYMYHVLCIFFVLQVFTRMFHGKGIFIYGFIFYPVLLTLVMLIAARSHRYIENPFLRLRNISVRAYLYVWIKNMKKRWGGGG